MFYYFNFIAGTWKSIDSKGIVQHDIVLTMDERMRSFMSSNVVKLYFSHTWRLCLIHDGTRLYHATASYKLLLLLIIFAHKNIIYIFFYWSYIKHFIYNSTELLW